MIESEAAREMMDLGGMRKQREYILRTLKRKFPTSVTNDLIQVINDQESSALLDEWFDVASSVTTLDDFLAVLRG